MIWQETARQAVAHLRKKPAGTGELAHACNVDRTFLDDALAPLVDAGKLIRINAFRNGAAEFDYRLSATWVPADADFDLCRGGGHAPVAAISAVAPATPSNLAPAPPPLVPAHAPRPAMTREERVAQGGRGATTKHARAALDRALAQSPQSLGWAPAPQPSEAESHQPADQQEQAMPEKARKPRPAKADTPQFQICALLVASGDLSRDELIAAVDCERQAFHNGLYQAKHAGRVVLIAKTDKYRVTAQGKAWWADVAAGADRAPAAKIAPRESAARKAPAASEVAIAPIQFEKRSFRCAVYSDGVFHLAKDGKEIDLTSDEHAQMLRYLERMAEQAA